MVVVPEEAEIIKRIYREYLEGASMLKIARNLTADGLKNGAGHTKWRDSNIRQILQNEKYMGDALLQKTYTVDFLTKKRVKNTGIMPQYYVKDNHEAIIPRDIFLQVQEEMVRRRVVYVSPSGRKRNFSCNHPFAQMVYCGECGELYRRIHWYNRGKKSIVWRCISRLESTSAKEPCRNRTVNETVLQNVSIKAVNRVLEDKDHFTNALQQNIAAAVRQTDTLSPEGIQKRLEELQIELIKRANNQDDYKAITDEIFRLRAQKKQSESESTLQAETLSRIRELQKFIAAQPNKLTEFDETLVKRLIQKITVYADKFTVEFKSGVSVDINE